MNTPAVWLRSAAVPMNLLHQKYGPLLELVREMIGVVPNCDPYLEIWPVGFRSYNVMVPNFLNLPFTLLGFGPPMMHKGLAMYVTSRVAACNYCSAHCCAFALRRGAGVETLGKALDPQHTTHTPAERAVIDMARGLATLPASFTPEMREALRKHYSDSDAEELMLSVAMMGFLNKFMDAVGVELESETVGEVRQVIGASGWEVGKHVFEGAAPDQPMPKTDSLRRVAKVFRLLPGAIRWELQWHKPSPNKWPAAGAFLQARTGHPFTFLSKLRHGRAAKAVVIMLRDNLDPAQSDLGLRTKALAGCVYAGHTGNPVLIEALAAVARHHGASQAECDAALARELHDPVLKLADALSPSPAATVDVSQLGLTPRAIIELVTWLSVCQALQRISAYLA